MERGEPLRFLVHLETDGAGELLERLREDPSLLVAPRAGHLAVTRNVGIGWGVFVLNTRGRCRSGRICVRRTCTSEVASHVPRNRTSGGGARLSCRSERTRSPVEAAGYPRNSKVGVVSFDSSTSVGHSETCAPVTMTGS